MNPGHVVGLKPDLSPIKGQVYLIGAGPGHLDLLTLGAVRTIGLADVFLLDDLVNPEVLQFARAGVQIMHVGKRGGCRSTPQAFIHKKMIALARAGKIVARIKGGDPFMFGRGGEELLALQQAGVEVSVISGITSGMAVPAALNIPLTHRGYTHGVTFITGHTQGITGHTQGDQEPDWRALAATGTTLVIYMGISNLARITQQLIQHGMAANTPAAAIRHGTLPQQQQVIATLGQLAGRVSALGFGSPAIVVIGEVVKFAQVAEQILQQQAA